MKVFGTLDRVIAGVVVSPMFLIVYGKILSDFAQLYITGHTTNFLWLFGDLFAKGSQPGSYSLIGFILVAVLGYSNMMIWLRLFRVGGRVVYKLTMPIYRFLAQYEIRKKNGMLFVQRQRRQKK